MSFWKVWTYFAVSLEFLQTVKLKFNHNFWQDFLENTICSEDSIGKTIQTSIESIFKLQIKYFNSVQ